MRVSCKQAGIVAVLILLVAIPAVAQVGGYGGLGGFGGIVSGRGFGGEVRPDVPSVRPWVSVSGGASRYYDNSADNKTRYGAGISGGVSVGRAWARTSLSGSYMTGGPLVNTYRDYGVGNGMSHVFGLQVMHQVTQRLAASVRAFGGSSNGGYGSVGGGLGGFGGMGPVGTSITINPSQGQINSSNVDLGFQNLADNGLVDNELFFSRVNFAGVNAGLSYTADQRNVFSFTVGASRVRRALSYLAGLNNLGAGARYTRVLTEKLSTGASYSYGTFEYPGYYGGNQVHSANWNLGYQINSKTSFSVYAGTFLYRVNNIGTVALPPQLAAILGAPTIQQINNWSYRGVGSGVSLSRTFRVGSAGVGYNRGANPGYGLLFPTLQESVSVNYGLGGNRYSIGASGHYSRGSSISAIAGSTNSKAVAVFASYRLLGSLHVTASASEYWLGASSTSKNRAVSANVGIAFSPGSYPLWF